MPDVNAIAVLLATVAAFACGAVYYGILGNQLAAAGGSAEEPRASTLAIEVLRCLVLAAVVAGLAAQGGVDGLAAGLALGAALWVGFPLVLWIGAVIHEKTPPRLAMVHGGDWLVKLLVVAAIAGGLS